MAMDTGRNPPGASRREGGRRTEKATPALVFTVEEARTIKERIDGILGSMGAMTTFEKNVLLSVRDKLRAFLTAKGYRPRL